MPLSIAQLTQHFVEKPGRSALLGCLALTLVVLIGHALVKTRSAAALPKPEPVAPVIAPLDGLTSDELAQRIENSSELWKILHQVRGVPADSVFRLSPNYYQPADPQPVEAAPAAPEVQVQRVDPNIQAQIKRRAIQVAAAELQLRSVVLAQDPVAVINAQMVRVGDSIGGFKVIAIQARQVVVEKDGTSVVLDMVR